MEFDNTAYNNYVLCQDCRFCSTNDICKDKVFYCPKWSGEVKSVGICKYYEKV